MEEDKKINADKDEVEEINEKLEKVSYTYWKRESDNPFSADFKPQKSDPNVSEVTQNAQTTSSNYGSAWNKAGTWEEKHLNKVQLEEFFNKSLKNKERVIGDSLVLDKISSYSGDTYYVFIRGKIKFVYDCEFTLGVRGLKDFQEVSGEVKVTEVSNHDLDSDLEFEFKEKFKGDADKANILESLSKKSLIQIQKMIRELFDELKESCLTKANI